MGDKPVVMITTLREAGLVGIYLVGEVIFDIVKERPIIYTAVD